ncbi:A24 family peptidase [Polycladidibacter stylochi]|uniref:A24 family peptidase n=1 Tax=Polycladidibacter stylochi TaxID=1807766 RepID=UPI00082BF88B|nr:prepilin peptidase [Pseudovibrio stylochi]
MLNVILYGIFPFLLIYAAFSDLFSMTIPNWLSLLLVAGFAAAALTIGLSWQEIAFNLGISFAVLVVGFTLFAFNIMGGGDAKFAAAIALWIGANEYTYVFLLLMSVYGGVLTLAILLYRRLPYLPSWLHRFDWLLRMHDQSVGVPYGIAISIAAIQIYPKTPWFTALGSELIL